MNAERLEILKKRYVIEGDEQLKAANELEQDLMELIEEVERQDKFIKEQAILSASFQTKAMKQQNVIDDIIDSFGLRETSEGSVSRYIYPKDLNIFRRLLEARST